jgi:hypothetical protein
MRSKSYICGEIQGSSVHKDSSNTFYVCPTLCMRHITSQLFDILKRR